MTYIVNTPQLGIVDLYSTVNTLGIPGIANLPSVTTDDEYASIVTGYDPNLGGGEFLFAKCAATVVAAQTISSITISGTTATLTTGSAHGLVVGQAIQISGAVPAGYNGTFNILTVPSSTTLTFSIPAPNTPTVSATTVGTYVAGIGVGSVCELAYSLVGGVLTISATPWTGTTVQGKPLGVAMANLIPGYAGWLQIEGAAVTLVNGTITVNAPVYWQSNGTVSSTGVASKQMVQAAAASLVSSTINSGNAAVTLPAYMALVFVNRPFAQGAIT